MKRLETMNGIKWVRYADGSIDGIGKFSRALFKVLRVTPLARSVPLYVVDRLDTKAEEMVPVRIIADEMPLDEALFQAEMYETEIDHDEVTPVDFESYEFWNTVKVGTRFTDKDGNGRVVAETDTFEFAPDKTRWIRHTAPEETLSSKGSIEFRPLGV